MIEQKRFIKNLFDNDVDFFTGVPDSHLNGFCNYLIENLPTEKNIISVNEGTAVATACGYYLATSKIPLVYMQNSGIGNAVNPIVSLADKDVYKIPMVLLIGWRGEPGEGDHPQHIKQGEITTKLLEIMGIPYFIAKDDDDDLEKELQKLLKLAKDNRTPVAIVATKGVFDSGEKSTAMVNNGYPLFREEAMEAVLDVIPKDSICLATTGRATRELYFLREKRNETHDNDFLNIGSMGHASSVALGLAIENQNKKVICFDGDSAAMMHMGAFTMVSKIELPNFIHVILNNGAHESVGGQPSAGMDVNFTEIAKGSGYNTIGKHISTKEEISNTMKKLLSEEKPSFVDIRIKKGLNGKLPPLEISSYEKMINDFMTRIQKK